VAVGAHDFALGHLGIEFLSRGIMPRREPGEIHAFLEAGEMVEFQSGGMSAVAAIGAASLKLNSGNIGLIGNGPLPAVVAPSLCDVP
jgi:hypothetical protein